MTPPNEANRCRIVSVVKAAPGVPRGAGRLVRTNVVEIAVEKDSMGRWRWIEPQGGWTVHVIDTLAQLVQAR